MSIGLEFESVLLAAQAGAQWAFARLYTEFNPRLLRYFSARIPGQAEDLAADTWMGIARGLGRFEGDEKGFRSWVFTIAHRRMADYWQERKKSQEPVDPGGMTEYPAPDDPEAAALGMVSAQAAARRIASVLSGDQAEVVLLRLLGDLDVEQVAQVLGKRPGTVRVIQHRALRRLVEEISLQDVTG
jgi:RNA polymerase sigma-70 factor, ECF subfamily